MFDRLDESDEWREWNIFAYGTRKLCPLSRLLHGCVVLQSMVANPGRRA